MPNIEQSPAAKQGANPCLHTPATCNDCDFCFEHLIGYNNYVCDLDGHDVNVATPPGWGCPLKRIACCEVV